MKLKFIVCSLLCCFFWFSGPAFGMGRLPKYEPPVIIPPPQEEMPIPSPPGQEKKEPIVETDPIFEGSPAKGITSDDLDKIRTPKVETDPVFEKSPASKINQELFDNLATFTAISFITEETDPLFEKSPARKITSDDINKIWETKIENDPIFSSHPANNLTQNDLLKLQALETSENSQVKIPIQSNPPDNPVMGNQYINKDSGYFCTYLCTYIADTPICGWTASNFFSLDKLNQEVFCKATNTNGSKPSLRIDNIEVTTNEDILVENHDNFIFDINYSDAFFRLIVIDSDEKAYNLLGYSKYDWHKTIYATTATLYITKISDDPEQVEGPWDWTREKVNFLGNMSKKVFDTLWSPYEMKVMFGPRNGENIPGVASVAICYTAFKGAYNLYNNGDGIYGFVIEATDFDHNRVIFKLPLKFRYKI